MSSLVFGPMPSFLRMVWGITTCPFSLTTVMSAFSVWVIKFTLCIFLLSYLKKVIIRRLASQDRWKLEGGLGARKLLREFRSCLVDGTSGRKVGILFVLPRRWRFMWGWFPRFWFRR